MQLDFTQFLTKFEKISGLRPVPHREYVENYVKAYYLPEMELENWIREHKVSLVGKLWGGLSFCSKGILVEASVRTGQLCVPEQQENEAEALTGNRGDRENRK